MKRPSPALVLASVAAGQINGKQIKNGSITGKDIKNDSLSGTDIKGDVRGPGGPRGPQGPPGPAGTGGPGGGVAVSYRLNVATIAAGDELRRVYALCPSGQVPTGGTYTAQPGLEISTSTFGDSTSANPDSWVVLVSNPTENPLQVEVQVACVTASSVSPF